MFEQASTNSLQNLTNQERPNSPTNKLQQYFTSSSYINRQQQLSVFISDLPIISLKETKSLNDLLRLIIKQNQLLGDKCQQQVVLLKQSYLKYEGMTKQLRKYKQKEKDTDRQMKDNFKELEAEQKVKGMKEEVKVLQDVIFHKQNQQRTLQRTVEQLESHIKEYQTSTAELTVTLKHQHQTNRFYSKTMEMLLDREYKSCEEFITEHLTLFKDQEPCQRILEYCNRLKSQKKKNKYYGKVKKAVHDFCYRLERIMQVVDPSLLKQQFNTEINGFSQLIDELILIGENKKNKSGMKKQKNLQQSTISEKLVSIPSSQHLSSSHLNNQNSLFENLLASLQKQTAESTNSKNQLLKEFEGLKKELEQEKKVYYELKEKYISDTKLLSEKIEIAQQTVTYYTQLLEEKDQTIQEKQQCMQQVEDKAQTYERELNIMALELQKKQKEKVSIDGQRQSYIAKLKQNYEQELKFLEKKGSQEKELLNEQIQYRKNQFDRINQELQQIMTTNKTLKQRNDDLDSSVRTLNAEGASLKKTNEEIKDDCNRYKKEIEVMGRYREVCFELEREIELQKNYINELEQKNKSLESIIQESKQKSSQNAHAKKELAQTKNCLASQKEKSQSYEAYIMEVKEENQRLKLVIKEMKKELQDVYVRISQLKKIQQSREQLEHQTHEDRRAIDLITKRQQSIKLQNLKLESENKKLNMELKHYRNIVNRIQL